jgi:hypothetical protein
MRPSNSVPTGSLTVGPRPMRPAIALSRETAPSPQDCANNPAIYLG